MTLFFVNLLPLLLRVAFIGADDPGFGSSQIGSSESEHGVVAGSFLGTSSAESDEHNSINVGLSEDLELGESQKSDSGGVDVNSLFGGDDDNHSHIYDEDDTSDLSLKNDDTKTNTKQPIAKKAASKLQQKGKGISQEVLEMSAESTRDRDTDDSIEYGSDHELDADQQDQRRGKRGRDQFGDDNWNNNNFRRNNNNGGQRRAGSLPSFLRGFGTTALQVFRRLELEEDRSRRTVAQDKQRWARQHRVEDAYNQFVNNLISGQRNFARNRAQRLRQISAQAENLDRRIQQIVSNIDLSRRQVMLQIDNMLRNAPQNVRQELRNRVRIIYPLDGNYPPIPQSNGNGQNWNDNGEDWNDDGQIWNDGQNWG